MSCIMKMQLVQVNNKITHLQVANLYFTVTPLAWSGV